jgi:hypothetical protein
MLIPVCCCCCIVPTAIAGGRSGPDENALAVIEFAVIGCPVIEFAAIG